MKNELISILRGMIKLLDECEYSWETNWFRTKLKIIQNSNEGSKEFIAVVLEIKKILAGMGSFTDLPMIPRKGSMLSKNNAQIKQFDLVKQFDDVIKDIG